MNEQQKNLIEMNRLVGDLIELVSSVFLTSSASESDKKRFTDKIAALDDVTSKALKDVGL